MRYRSPAVLAAIALALAGCINQTAQPPTPAETSAPSPTATASPSPTATPVVYPMRLEQVGQFGGAASGLALSGNTIYLAVGQRFLTVDVTDPAQPAITGRSMFLPGPISRIVAYDHYALVVDDASSVTWSVFDVSSTGDPQLVTNPDAERVINEYKSSASTPVAPLDYTFEYWPDWFYQPYQQPLTVRDASGDEVTTAFAGLPDGETFVRNGLIVRGHYVYALDYYGLVIFDLSIAPERSEIDPQPDRSNTFWQIVGNLQTDVGTVHDRSVPPQFPDLCVNGSILYTHSGTRHWSLENPEQPEEISSRALFRCDFEPVNGGEIELTSSADGKYVFLDTRDPAHPSIQNISTGAGKGEVKALAGDQLVYYTVEEVSSGQLISHVLIYDVSDPVEPNLLGEYAPVGWAPRSRFTVLGKYLYIDISSGRDPGQTVLDISDLTAPKKVDPPNPIFFKASTLVHGSIIYAAYGDELQMYHDGVLSKPFNSITLPYMFHSFPEDHPCDCLWYINGRLFIAGTNPLLVVDVRDPTNPQVVAVWNQTPHQVAGYGDTLYFHMRDAGVGIFKLVPN